jgi:acetoin:2,6-dichlorophenolindophenol oxidoreductase subunit alpha
MMSKPLQKTEDQIRIQHLRWMILARLCDERMAVLYRKGGYIPGGSVFLGKGQEAFSAAIGMQLKQGDIFGPLIRDLAGRLAFGEDLLTIMRTHFMRKTGPMRGRDGNIHRGQLEKNLVPMISHLGTLTSVIAGMMLAKRLKGELTGTELPIAATSIGDGGMQTGAFHEGLNVVAIERLPMVILVADNQYSYRLLQA